MKSKRTREYSYYVWITKEGQFHRNPNQGPAREYDDGDLLWFVYSKYHRLEGPSGCLFRSNTYYWDINNKYMNYFKELDIY